MPHHQDLAGGYLSSHGGGWGGYLGTPNHPDLTRGIFHPVMVGVPQVPLTIQTWPGGYPIQSLGVPALPLHHPDLARGYPRYPPPSRPGWGYPIQSWWGYPGYPSPSRPGWEVPQVPPSPTIQTWNGVHPPQTWDMVPPATETWDGVPPRPGMGYLIPQT